VFLAITKGQFRNKVHSASDKIRTRLFFSFTILPFSFSLFYIIYWKQIKKKTKIANSTRDGDAILCGNPAIITPAWKTRSFASPAFAGFAFVATYNII
jgi:hypothetical protein